MSVTIALIYPELLGTYGDGGNALVLRERLRWRGIDADIVMIPAGEPVPRGCDIYLLGGGEDEPQTLAADGLRGSSGLRSAVSAGAVVLAVCAGFQIAGTSFPGRDGEVTEGLGILDVETRRSYSADVAPRAVGDLAIRADFGILVGYENHGGRTRVLTGSPLGSVLVGVGNGDPAAVGAEGWVSGKVFGTYLHGPVLAQNSHFADHLLSLVVGPLPPLDRPDPGPALHEARLASLGVKT